MKTRRNVLGMIVMLIMLAVASPSVSAAPVNESPKEQVERLEKRLEEIKNIDKSTLSKAEKKALRGEVKMLKKEMKAVSGGVYISVGAILLIALLIILLA